MLVDYSHTPDSLENALRAARELAEHRVIAVFGAGGDRDRGKRPLMGEIAAREADVAIVTSDNPRSEDPDAIIDEILAGIDDRAGVEVDADRRAAIRRAVELAEPGDVLVIAGKGHEQGQEFAGGRKEPFDDVAVAREALRAVGRRVKHWSDSADRRHGGRASCCARIPTGARRRPVAGGDRLARRRPRRPVRRDPGRARRRRLVRRDGARRRAPGA